MEGGTWKEGGRSSWLAIKLELYVKVTPCSYNLIVEHLYLVSEGL